MNATERSVFYSVPVYFKSFFLFLTSSSYQLCFDQYHLKVQFVIKLIIVSHSQLIKY